MLAEPHAKVYVHFIASLSYLVPSSIVMIMQVFSMFLDTLVKFIEERKEQIDDWLFIMLLRLLHRQGTDMLSSVHFKLQIVLEHIRWVLIRIYTVLHCQHLALILMST